MRGRRLTPFLLLAATGLVLAGCGSAPRASGPTACGDLIPGCQAERLPDVVLTGDATDGALRSTDGFDTTGVMSADAALRRDGTLEHLTARTVRVVLGSADATALHWGHGPGLYYAIEWAGVCFDPSTTTGGGAGQGPCRERTWSTVLDAHTGKLVASGT